MELCGWLCTGNNDPKGESEISRAGTATTVPEGTSEGKEAASSLVSVGLAAAHGLRNGLPPLGSAGDGMKPKTTILRLSNLT